jgi:hypothetical protein
MKHALTRGVAGSVTLEFIYIYIYIYMFTCQVNINFDRMYDEVGEFGAFVAGLLSSDVHTACIILQNDVQKYGVTPRPPRLK